MSGRLFFCITRSMSGISVPMEGFISLPLLDLARKKTSGGYTSSGFIPLVKCGKTQRLVVRIYPHNESFFRFFCYDHQSKRSLSLLPSYWGSAGAAGQSCEFGNCMKERVLDSSWSGVTFGNCAQRL